MFLVLFWIARKYHLFSMYYLWVDCCIQKVKSQFLKMYVLFPSLLWADRQTKKMLGMSLLANATFPAQTPWYRWLVLLRR